MDAVMMAIDAIMRPVEASLRKASRTSARGTFVSVLVVDVNVGSLQIRDSEKGDLQKQGLELEALPHLWRGKAADRVAICCILHAAAAQSSIVHKPIKSMPCVRSCRSRGIGQDR